MEHSEGRKEQAMMNLLKFVKCPRTLSLIDILRQVRLTSVS